MRVVREKYFLTALLFRPGQGDASFVGPGSTRRLLRRLLTEPLLRRVSAFGNDPYRVAP